MDNGKKVILDLCGGTGAWSKPYKEAGYDVRVITLPEHSVTDVIFQAETISFVSQIHGDTQSVEIESIYGILAAPPCTEFSIAKTTAPRDFEKGMTVVQSILRIIWACQLGGHKLNFWAIENPRGLLTRFLGKPAFQFEQWEFGGKIEKPTCIWGNFRPPAKTVTEKPLMEKFRNKVSNQNLNSREYASPKCPEEYQEYVGKFGTYQERRAAIRAITPKGFAEAFYRANK